MEAGKYSLFDRLCNLMAEKNYYRYIQRYEPKGKRPFEEGEEDGHLVGAFLVRPYDVERFMGMYDSHMADVVLFKRGSPEETIISLSKSHDGAIIVGNDRISNYTVLDGFIGEALKSYNASHHNRNFKKFKQVAPLLLPQTFTRYKGGNIQIGSKSSNALAVPLACQGVATYLIKITAFGDTGTGKVIEIERNGDDVYRYTEFFLLGEDALERSEWRELKEQAGTDTYFDPEKKVIGVHQEFETPYQVGIIGRASKKFLVKPADIGIDIDKSMSDNPPALVYNDGFVHPLDKRGPEDRAGLRADIEAVRKSIERIRLNGIEVPKH